MTKSTKSSTIQSISVIDQDELALVRAKMDSFAAQLNELQADIQFIKEFFLAKQAKKEKRRQKKEQERLEIERQKKAEQDRRIYEDIIWKIRRYPWEFMPAPPSGLSQKESELVSLLAQSKTDQEIVMKMGIKENSISPRLCVINKKLGLNSREAVIAYYLKYRKTYRSHRRRRCIILLSWLLNPPPCIIHRRDLALTWKQSLGRSKNFHYAGPYIRRKVFASLNEYLINALNLKLKGLDNAAIAEKMKIKETTVKGYFGQIRGDVKLFAGVTVTSDEMLMGFYTNYLKRVRKQK